MTIARFFCLLLLFTSVAVEAQMYKWTTPDGRINYSDKPPPASVTNIQAESISTSSGNVTLPYELAQAVKKMPVTLYSSDSIFQSGEARDFLKKNGIPFTEKTVSSNDDIDKLKEITGSNQIPVLYVGKNKLAGFNPGEWRTTLTAAGYPDSNVLPANYHFSAPQPLVPKIATLPSTNNEVIKTAPSQPDAPARDSNGFRF